MLILLQALQLLVALTILNVWLLRADKSTPFRGAGAPTLREEFRSYGLSDGAFRIVGIAKVTIAVLLIAGLFVPGLTRPAAVGLAALMVGAIAMHLRVGDPLQRSAPAATVLAGTLILAGTIGA